jgi:hypothetical protein
MQMRVHGESACAGVCRRGDGMVTGENKLLSLIVKTSGLRRVERRLRIEGRPIPPA